MYSINNLRTDFALSCYVVLINYLSIKTSVLVIITARLINIALVYSRNA